MLSCEWFFFITSAKYLKRFEAVFFVNHANGPKLSYARAAKVLRKSKAFVQKWVKRFTEVGNVDNLPERGRSRATTSKEDEMIVRLFRWNSTLALRQGQTLLRKKALHVGLNTIKRRLKESKLTYCSTIQKPLCTSFRQVVHVSHFRKAFYPLLNKCFRLSKHFSCPRIW